MLTFAASIYNVIYDVMEKFFNTAGPQKLEINYCIDPLSRFNLDEILSLIRQQCYFVFQL